jgi:hypothetical protein
MGMRRKTRVKQMQETIEQYRKSGRPWPATTHQIAKWAMENGRWEISPSSALNQCAAQVAEALRQDIRNDPQGRTTRAKHAARILRDGEPCVLWDDMETASRAFMQMSFAQRRRQIVGDCVHLKTDVDSYNENNNPGAPIQIPFDFTLDIQETEAVTEEGKAAKVLPV